MSDSETDFSVVKTSKQGVVKSKKQATTKRKADPNTSTPNTPGSKLSKKSQRSSDLFQLEGDVDHRPTSSGSGTLASTLVSCVTNGKVKRTADVIGDFYIELKVYHKADVVSTPPEERWKKASVALKVQLDRDTPQWDGLQTFMRRVHELFEDSEPVYYSDKK